MRKVLAAVALVLVGSACTPPWEGTIRDLEQAEVRDATVTVYNNINRHPNIARVCTDGVAWVTTSRDFTAIQRMEEWDEFCPRESKVAR